MVQSKPVTTIRYIMNDSYESHVIDVQKKKRHFADLLFSKKRLSDSDSNLSQFEVSTE